MLLENILIRIDGFLVAMAAAVLLALAAPALGAAGSLIPFNTMTQVGIAVVFFLHGANLSREALHSGASNWRLHSFVQASTFILFPLFGLLIFEYGGALLPPDMRLGFFFLCALCSTISSSVAMVAMARGNIAAAIFDASLSGIIGMVVTPALIGLIHPGGAGNVPMLRSILDIAYQLLAPFFLGHLLRPLLTTFIARWKPWITRLDRAVIVLIVYTAFCQSTQDGVWSKFSYSTLLEVVVLVALLLLAVLTVTTVLSRRLSFSTEDEITAVFCGSKKSLANGAPIAKILFGASPALGAILLPLMIYHQLQLIVCSFIARRYAQRSVSSASFASKSAASGNTRVSERYGSH
jgi:sodium/bile acid cotransporter 7